MTMDSSKKQNFEQEFCCIEFEPIGRRGKVRKDQSLLESAHQLGVDIVSICGGEGSCKGCSVNILSGQVSRSSKNEQNSLHKENDSGSNRLACQTYPVENLKIHVPLTSLASNQRVIMEGKQISFDVSPIITFYKISFEQDDFDGIDGDADWMLETLAKKFDLPNLCVDIKLLNRLSSMLFAGENSFELGVRHNEIVALGPWFQGRLGLAIDLGTTGIVMYLMNLDDGKVIATKGCMNPQISIGEDVIVRLTRAGESENKAALLQKMVTGEINQFVLELYSELAITPEDILEVVIAGNTVMHHLLLGLPVKRLGLAPYSPAIKQAVEIKARDIDIKVAPGAYIHFLPNIAGFIGGDHVAMLLATGVHEAQKTILALDIGTNTEICLSHKGKMTSVSCPSGPAFEGAHIKFGMRACNGAIEHVRMVNGKLECQTIGNVAPVGICGSGILDAIAQLYLAGVVDDEGRIGDHPNVRLTDGMREFALTEKNEDLYGSGIAVTQKDIRELQLAKGAIRAGIDLLLEHVCVLIEDINKVVVAGAFGSYIDVESAISIGMLPSISLDRFEQVGNAAGMGVQLVLVSKNYRTEAKKLSKKINYLELADTPNFAQIFARSMYLGSHI